MKTALIFTFASLFVLSACGTYSSSSVKPASATSISDTKNKKQKSEIILTEGDITDRPYKSLGDISVTVRKVTIFDKDPTQASVADALKERAAEMGADAVILVRYGTVGVSLLSWGEMDGNGRAIIFQ